MVQEPVHLEQSAERSGLAAGGTCPPFKAVNSHFRQKAAFLTQDSFFFFLFKIYLFLALPGLRCCAQAFSSCGEQGSLSSCGMQAFHCDGFS